VFQNTNDSSTYPVSVQLIVPRAAPCTPTQLLPIVSNLSTGSTITAALPVPLQARIVDDCGSPTTTGTVVASFSSGDPAVTMLPTGNGQWTGTWFPHDIAGGEVDVTVTAGSPSLALSGSTTVGAIVSANPTAPVVSQAGVVSAAAPATQLPVAPGGFISIFGSNLASARESAASLPLPTTLAGTQVLLGGQPLALDFADTGQINAIVPFGIQPNTIQQLTVIHSGIASPPETLVVAPAEPTVFTQDQSGAGAGVIFVVKPDGKQFLNTASAPASAGDALVIYCSGLGAVTPPVPDGSAAPSSPAAKTTAPITVTIGGNTAPVTFSGLVPGYAGLYQVNVTVPGGIAPAADVPLVITAGSASSPAVTLAIQ
jgi:adhesin/invasin